MTRMDRELRLKLAQILASSRRGVTARVNDNDRNQADAVLNSFGVVELPDTVADCVGQPYWTVERRDCQARVEIRGSDGLLVMDSVSNPIRTSDHARSLAAGLLAGSKHLRQESMTTITRYAEAE